MLPGFESFLRFVQKLLAFVKKAGVADMKLAEVLIFDKQSEDRLCPGIKKGTPFCSSPGLCYLCEKLNGYEHICT